MSISGLVVSENFEENTGDNRESKGLNNEVPVYRIYMSVSFYSSFSLANLPSC